MQNQQILEDRIAELEMKNCISRTTFRRAKPSISSTTV